MIIDHEHPKYREKWDRTGVNKYNGAFYYSKEIVKYIIPNVKTDRNWITVNVQGVGCDHAIVFIHNNKHPENYDWLQAYDDLVLVCGVESTMEKVAHLGKPIYLPLSVNVEYVEGFRAEKTREVAFVGRPSKRKGIQFPENTVFLEGMSRTRLLREMAKFRKVYAVGRCAIEARILGCEVLPYDPRYPDPDVWKVVDAADAAKELQKKLNEIDNKGRLGDDIFKGCVYC